MEKKDARRKRRAEGDLLPEWISQLCLRWESGGNDVAISGLRF